MSKRTDKFRFRKLDTIGSIEAEGDDFYLKNCFIDTGEIGVLDDLNDARRLVVGRTGFGKTALLHRLIKGQRKCIVIRPESLALAYISNSTILNFFMNLGVDLDTFFRLLWRHVFTVEVIQRNYKITDEKEKTSAFSYIRQFFQSDKKKAKALEYLEKWGCSFWEETENRIKEVTSKFENELQAAARVKIPGFSVSSEAASKLTEEQKQEIVQRAQVVVNQIQIRELSEVIDMLQDLLEDSQKTYFIVIDQLDEKWVEDQLRYRLIRSLIETTKDFRRVRNIKIVAAIRLDLLDRVFRLTRDPGFQEEKFESLYIRLQWTKAQLIELLDKRIDCLIHQKFCNRSVTHRDVLPSVINKQPAIDYILERTMMRPRDVILFFNLCIQQAVDRPAITVEMLRKAEGEYSRNRLRSLADEWFADYPNILRLVPLFRQRPKLFAADELTAEQCQDFCLDLMIQPPPATDEISIAAKNTVETLISPDEFRKTILQILYRIGFLGLKLENSESVRWSLLGRTSISRSEISSNTRIMIHPAFWRVTGVIDRSSS